MRSMCHLCRAMKDEGDAHLVNIVTGGRLRITFLFDTTVNVNEEVKGFQLCICSSNVINQKLYNSCL